MTDCQIRGQIMRAKMLAHITHYSRQHDRAPSYREIGEAVGLSSSSTVWAHLRILQREGKIIRDPACPRSIRVVGVPRSESERLKTILLRIKTAIVRHLPDHNLRDQLQREIDEALHG